MVYLISYDLSVVATPDDYQRLEAALKLLGGRKVLHTQWTVTSDRTASSIEAYLQLLIGPKDRLLVAQITPNLARKNLLTDFHAVSQAEPQRTPTMFDYQGNDSVG